jgi:hypothetical protein
MGALDAIRKTGLALFAAVLVTVAVVADSEGQPPTVTPEAASILEIVLELDSVEVGVAEAGTWLPVYLTNTVTAVGGFEISLLLDRPDLFKFSSDSIVETTIVCIDTLDCDPADTTIDTVAASIVDTAGTAISGWEFVQGRALFPTNIKIAAVADEIGGASILPLPPGGPRLLLQVYLEKIASDSLLDTLTDRTTNIFIDVLATSFSTQEGQTIGRLDSIVCFDPPTCDSTDTVFYTDTSAFFYVDGVRTFAGGCVLGDVNESGAINSSDIIYLVNFVFKGGPEPTCSPTTGDVNCSGSTNSADIIFLVNYVFKGGPPPSGC